MFWMVYVTMWKERELRSRFVRGTCRLTAFDDRRVWTGMNGCRRSVRHYGVPVCKAL